MCLVCVGVVVSLDLSLREHLRRGVGLCVTVVSASVAALSVLGIASVHV